MLSIRHGYKKAIVAALVAIASSHSLAAQDRVTDSDKTVLETGEFQGRMLVGEYAFAAQVPMEDFAAWSASPEDYFLNAVEGTLDEPATNRGNLHWIKNTADKVVLDSPSQVTAVAVDLVNSQAQARDLLLEAEGAAALSWHYRDHQGNLISHVDDFARPLAGRRIFDANPVIPLRLEPDHGYRIYLFIFSPTSSTLLSATLWDTETFRAQRVRGYLIDGMYFGLVMALILYSLFLFIALRQQTYLHFLFYIAASGAVIYIGTGTSTLFGLQSHLAYSIPLFILSLGMMAVFGALFTISLLNIRNTHLTLYRFWVATTILCIVTMFTAVFVMRTGAATNEATLAIFLLALLAIGFGQGTSIYTLVHYWRKSAIVKYWFVGTTLHTWMILIWAMLQNSTVNTNIDWLYLAQLFTLFDAVILSAVIAYNYKAEQSNRQLAQQKSLESLRLAHDVERAKSHFVSTIGHDLRAPVQAISHFTQSLKHSLPEKAQAGLSKIDENVASISEFLDTMIELSQTEWRGSNPKLEPVPLSNLLTEMRTEFNTKAADKGLQLKTDTTWCSVRSDRICLSQILRNLIENAIKYTDHGYVKVLVQEEADAVRITVEDTGRGIPEQALEHIFQEFYQVNGDSNARSGVGLGLSIVDRLTKRLGIELTVRSVPGKGSRFQLKLEKVVENAAALNKAQIIPVHSGPSVPGTLIGIDVVVINGDNNKLMNPLTDRLIAWGAKVMNFQRFGEATRHLQRLGCRPQLIMTDANSYLQLDFAQPQWEINDLFAGETPVIILESETDQIPADRAVNKWHTAVRMPLNPMRFRALIQRCLGMKPRKTYLSRVTWRPDKLVKG